MRVEFVKKELPPQLTFKDLLNGDTFRFKGEDNDTYLWMKIGNSAMQVVNTKDVIPVLDTAPVVLYESYLVVMGK